MILLGGDIAATCDKVWLEGLHDIVKGDIAATCDRVWLEGLQDIVRRVILLPLVTGFC